MDYRVRWKLVGRNGRRLDEGGIGETFRGYAEAAVAINELLRTYPEVRHVAHEGYWLARRSADADLAVWVWIERADAGADGESEPRTEGVAG
jgi:hypothetical protein